MKDVGLDSVDVDGIVVDLHSSQTAYQEVMAQHGLTEVPTHHAGYLYELLTGRVLLGEDCRTELTVGERPYYMPIRG